MSKLMLSRGLLSQRHSHFSSQSQNMKCNHFSQSEFIFFVLTSTNTTRDCTKVETFPPSCSAAEEISHLQTLESSVPQRHCSVFSPIDSSSWASYICVPWAGPDFNRAWWCFNKPQTASLMAPILFSFISVSAHPKHIHTPTWGPETVRWGRGESGLEQCLSCQLERSV